MAVDISLPIPLPVPIPVPLFRRLTLALLLSLTTHALLLSLTFGGNGAGLPGLGFPWQERRAEAPDLRVVIVPVLASTKATTMEPVHTSTGSITPVRESHAIKPPHNAEQPLKPPVLIAVNPTQASIAQTPTDAPQQRPMPVPSNEAKAISPTAAPLELTTPAATREPAVAVDAVAATVSPPITAPTVIAVERSETATFAVPPQPSTPPAPAPANAVTPSVPSPESMLPTPVADAAKPEAQLAAQPGKQQAAQQDAQRQTDKLDAARVEAARAARAENAQLENAKAQAARQEATRVDAARQEAARLETQRQELARLATTQIEMQRRELARQDAARIDAARDAARLDTARQEGVRHDAARLDAARALAEKEEDAKRDARREAMGRVLNDEAAQRKAFADTMTAETAARSPSTSPAPLPYSLSTARRARLWGRTDPNAELVQYAETWARKIESNTPLDTVRDVAKQPHTDPMVTVAIRRDGSVESVTFVLSSGVAEVDEAIRRIVQSHTSYRAFPPALAREVDVIKVRRTWHFDIGIRLY